MLKISKDLEEHLQGTLGESVFHQPVRDLMAAIADQFETDGMLSTVNRMASYGDERSKVLLAALASEAVVDKILGAFMPLYQPLRRTNIYLKIQMLEALALVPKHLTDAADLIRDVRNQFAHKLTVEKLSDIDNSSRGNVVVKMQQYCVRLGIKSKARLHDRTFIFETIAEIATTGLWTYLPLVRDLNSAVRDQSLEKQLRLQAERRLSEQAEAILAHVQAPAPLANRDALEGEGPGGTL
ncbi:hypothetical protein [Rhodanobacter sp. T12-5]|uniref:hypothetical protein n=1 Tax=Rhodanobacter sp. T12-5 TaxID=2024611 RepID=UPI0011ED97D7|nr:hypothetical protein [Rhodanobacter sp. T12-5]KAA0072143.1 hypothetical protein CIW53_02830 [Rhodanobacter sp. T12-5]